MASFAPSSYSYGVAGGHGGRGPGEYHGYDPLLPDEQKHKTFPTIALITLLFTLSAGGAWFWMRRTQHAY